MRLGWSAAVLWLEAEQADWYYHGGDWDEAVSEADGMLAGSDPDRATLRHVREVDAHVIRALIRLARDDHAGANEDSATGLSATREFAQGSWAPQILFPALACRARVLMETNSTAEADTLVTELLGRWRSNPVTFASNWLSYVLPTIIALGRGEELSKIAKSASVKTRWLEAAVALAEGDPREAAGIFAQIGSLPDEAQARLRAAEVLAAAGRPQEADGELARALDFYRAVGATRYIREGEALLAAR